MEMVKKLLIVSLVCSLLIPIAYAWTTLASSGTWIDDSLPTLETLGNNEGRVNSTNQALNVLADGQGYEMEVIVTAIEGNRQDWWWINGVKKFFFALDFESTSSGEDVYGMFYLAHEMGVWVNTSEARMGTDLHNMAGDFWDYPNAPVNDVVYRIRFIRIDETHAQISYLAPTNNDVFTVDPVPVNRAWNETFVVSASFWNDLDAYLYVGHSGSGKVKVELTALTYNATIEGFSETAGANPIQWIYDGLGFFFGLLGALGGVVGSFLPILPIFLLFWIVDAGIASAQQGSITPIGNAVRTLYDWLMVIWGYLVEFGKLIWDIITFWT